MNEIMTAADLAEYLRINRNTAYRWRRKGIGPQSLIIGCRSIRYRRTDVDDWVCRAIRNTRLRGQ